jgi:hypothetical protein
MHCTIAALAVAVQSTKHLRSRHLQVAGACKAGQAGEGTRTKHAAHKKPVSRRHIRTCMLKALQPVRALLWHHAHLY